MWRRGVLTSAFGGFDIDEGVVVGWLTTRRPSRGREKVGRRTGLDRLAPPLAGQSHGTGSNDIGDRERRPNIAASIAAGMGR